MCTQLDIQLTTKDASILETMLERCDDPKGPFAALLRWKLDRATVFLREDIPPGVVTMNSHVVYSIGDKLVGPQLIVQVAAQELPDYALSIHTIDGLALLGLAEGGTATLNRNDGIPTKLIVKRVSFQPEADMRYRRAQMSAGLVGRQSTRTVTAD